MPLSDPAGEALNLLESGCQQFHDDFIDGVENRYQAYQGRMTADQDSAKWMSKLHPPFVNADCETTLAGLLDGPVSFRVRPMPRLWNPGEYEQAADGALALEILLRHQLSCDRFEEKLRPFAQQEQYAGITVLKTYWRKETVKRPVLQAAEPSMLGRMFGANTPRYGQTEQDYERYNGPCSEVVDVRDFFWHEAATDLQKSLVVAHRVWMTLPEIEQAGFSNVEELRNSLNAETQDDNSSLNRDNRRRTKDMIEVMEIWWRTRDGIKTVTLGNRKVELKAPRPNPFWHGEYPFIACSTRPNPFTLLGMSQVERVQHLQEAYWNLDNQTQDNLRMLNNAVTVVNTSLVMEPGAFVREPLAQWPVQGPVEEAVKDLPVDGTTTQLALPHMERIRMLMQNLGGSQPFTTSSEARNLGADTATEAAITTNLSQRAMMAMKEQLTLAFQRMGQQWIELNKQFLRSDVLVAQIGLDEETELAEISPQIFQPHDYLFDVQPMSDSMMRSERKSEANAMLQTFLQLFPIQAAAAQAGAATMPNVDAYVKDWLEANDVQDPARFFSEAQPQQPAPQPGGASQQPAETGGPGGVTAPQAYDASSPSNQTSVSPEQFQQRALAQTGGVNNT